MSSTIPFSQVVSVTPGVLSAGGQALDLSGLLLTQNAYAPYNTILSFPSAASVTSYFGAGSTEAQMAAIYFGGTNNSTVLPATLLMTLYPEVATAGFLRSANIGTLTLGTLQTYSGVLTITVAGTPHTSSTITLSSATSFSNAASIIQAGFTSPGFTVTFDSIQNAFIFTTTTTGSVETMSYASGSLAAELFLTQATGAVLSQGAAPATPAAFMANVLTLNQNWATLFTTWESVLTEKEAFANWSNSVAPRYVYACQDSDVNALTANNTVTFGNYLQTNQLQGTIAVYGNYTHTAFVAGYGASLNFSQLNGRTTLCFQSQSGLVAYVTNQTNYTAVLSNGYNTYAYFGSNNPANNQNWMSPGSISGKWLWADTYYNQIWLNANLQLAIVNLLTTVNSVPYNAQGNGLIYSAALVPISAGVNFGAIRKGVQPSVTQAAAMQYAIGFDISTTLYSQGFYLYIGTATAPIRAARQSPPITLYYQDGESVQQISLASIVVQ